MSRLRATLARSDADREISVCMSKAEQALRQAIRIVPPGPTPGDPSGRRALMVRRSLERTLGSLQGVGRVAAPYDTEDPDLNPNAPPPVRREPKPKAPPVVTESEDE